MVGSFKGAIAQAIGARESLSKEHSTKPKRAARQANLPIAPEVAPQKAETPAPEAAAPLAIGDLVTVNRPTGSRSIRSGNQSGNIAALTSGA